MESKVFNSAPKCLRLARLARGQNHIISQSCDVKNASEDTIVRVWSNRGEGPGQFFLNSTLSIAANLCKAGSH